MADGQALKALQDYLRPVASDHGMYLGDLEPIIEAIIKGLRDDGMSEQEIVETFGDPIGA